MKKTLFIARDESELFELTMANQRAVVFKGMPTTIELLNTEYLSIWKEDSFAKKLQEDILKLGRIVQICF